MFQLALYDVSRVHLQILHAIWKGDGEARGGWRGAIPGRFATQFLTMAEWLGLHLAFRRGIFPSAIAG